MTQPESPSQDNTDAPEKDNADVPAGEDNVTGEQPKADSQAYLLTFKSKDEAEKAFKESQRKITEQGTELARIRSDMESLKGQAQLATAISDLAKAKGQAEQKPVLDFNKFMDELAEEYQTDPKSAMRKQMATLNGWMSEEGEKARAEARKAAQEELATMKAELYDTLERKDSVYDKYKDTIDELVAGGMKLSAAKKFVKDKIAVPDEVAQRSTPTPTVGNGRTPPPKKDGYFASANERDHYKKNFNLSDEEIQYLEAERTRNLAIEVELQKRKESV